MVIQYQDSGYGLIKPYTLLTVLLLARYASYTLQPYSVLYSDELSGVTHLNPAADWLFALQFTARVGFLHACSYTWRMAAQHAAGLRPAAVAGRWRHEDERS